MVFFIYPGNGDGLYIRLALFGVRLRFILQPSTN